MKNLFYFTLVTGFFISNAHAQKDKLVMINGRTLTGKVIRLSKDSLVFSLAGKANKVTSVENYRVFSIEYEEGKKQILYYKDSTEGRDYTVKEMEIFIKGEQDAYEFHKSGFPFVFSTALAATGAYLVGGENFVILGIPFISAITSMVILKPRIKKEFITDKELIKDMDYRRGYKRVAKVKRNKQIFLGSLIGTAAGITLRAISK